MDTTAPLEAVEAVELLTYDEAARRLTVGRRRIPEFVATGRLERVRLSPRTSRITARSVDAFIAQLVARGLAE